MVTNVSSPISFSGLASGVDTASIVTKLMAVEQQPLNALNAQKTTETNRLQAYSGLNSLLIDLKTAASDMNITSQVQTTKTNLSSESAFTATSTSAAPGSYSIAVTQLAQVQKAVSNIGYASDSTSILGTGTVTVNGKVITLDSTNNSLQGLMSAINTVADSTGVSATIINDGSGTAPYRLVLTGKDASTNFTMTSDLKDSLGTVIPFDTTTVQNAQQAKLIIDGINVVSNSNTVNGVISGVTLNLNAISPISNPGPPIQYTPTKMEIVADTGALEKKINTFVSSYNKVMNWIVAGYAQGIPAIGTTTTTDTTSTSTTPTDAQLSQLLRGDVTVNSIKRGLQSLLTNPVNNSGSLHILSEIGISTNIDGTLNVNTTKLETTLKDNFSGVTKLLAGDEIGSGVMKSFNSYLLNETSKATGMYAEKQTISQTKQKNLDNQITQKTALLDKTEATLKAQFTAMELMISNLNSQSSYLNTLFSIAGTSNTSSSSSSSSS